MQLLGLDHRQASALGSLRKMSISPLSPSRAIHSYTPICEPLWRIPQTSHKGSFGLVVQLSTVIRCGPRLARPGPERWEALHTFNLDNEVSEAGAPRDKRMGEGNGGALYRAC